MTHDLSSSHSTRAQLHYNYNWGCRSTFVHQYIKLNSHCKLVLWVAEIAFNCTTSTVLASDFPISHARDAIARKDVHLCLSHMHTFTKWNSRFCEDAIPDLRRTQKTPRSNNVLKTQEERLPLTSPANSDVRVRVRQSFSPFFYFQRKTLRVEREKHGF